MMMVWSGEERDTDGSPDCLLACLAWQCGDVEKEGRKETITAGFLVHEGGCVLQFGAKQDGTPPGIFYEGG
jgi:hypothetical protein